MLQSKNISTIGENCTGCGACELICPKQAINMVPDQEGFIYPSVNETCIDCGACLKHCHTQLHREHSIIKHALAAVTKDQKIYKKSASGGIFATLAKAFLQNKSDAYICGAAFIEGEVRHILTNNIKEIELIQNSKYVQSNTCGLYKKIKNLLKSGKSVLFSGTPCQVNGLYAYLGCHPQNLVTIDIICHGVPSPLLLKKDLERYYNSARISRIDFRWKNALFAKSAYFLCLSQRKYVNVFSKKIVSSNADPYFSLFMNNATFRMSCYSCKYANLNRVGDITIGDCDTSNLYPSFHPKAAVSTVILNSEQGRLFWTEKQSLFDTITIDLIRESKANKQLSAPSVCPEERRYIYKEMDALDAVEFRKKYGRFDPWYKDFVFKLINLVPFKLR